VNNHTGHSQNLESVHKAPSQYKQQTNHVLLQYTIHRCTRIIP